MYVETKTLPPVILRALERISYGRKDISVESRESFSMACGGGDGYKAFCLVINLDSGAIQEHWGSWGGANMFNPTNAVDLNTATYPLPENGAVIDGSIGGGKPTYAALRVHPSRLVKLLPAKAELSERLTRVLNCYRYKSSYRKDELARLKATPAETDELVRLGLIDRNRAGACSLTTAGRNAMPRYL